MSAKYFNIGINMRANEFITEIEKLSATQYTGGKDYLNNLTVGHTLAKLPGPSGLLYSVDDDDRKTIKIWHPEGITPTLSRYAFETDVEYKQRLTKHKQKHQQSPGLLIGKLELYKANWFPVSNAFEVSVITVHEDYRGGSIAKALYGIALSVLKLTLLAGDSQTPGGRKNWVSLYKIPGVELQGYVRIKDLSLDDQIDTIMAKLGGQYLGQSVDNHFFGFDVLPATTQDELEAYIDTAISKVYGGSYITGLYATWTGK